MTVSRRFAAIAAITLLVLCLTGCMTGCLQKRTVPLTPSQQVSLTLNQSLSVISTLNKSVAVDVIAVNRQGLISKDLTNSILTWQKAIAVQIIAAETIQRSGQSDAEKAIAIKNAFAQLALPPEIAALLKDPQTDQAVVGLVSTIQSIVSLIRSLSGA